MTPSPFNRIAALAALAAAFPLAAPAAAVAIPLENPSFGADSQMLVGWHPQEHAQGKSFQFAVDTEKPRSPPASARLRRTGPEPWGMLAQVVNVKPEWVGRQVRLSGYLRTAGATGTGGALILQATSGGGSVLAHDHMDERRVRGTEGWKRVTTQVKLPAGAAFVKVAVLLEDDGTLWADDLLLELLD
jgi:hypothetical protein